MGRPFSFAMRCWRDLRHGRPARSSPGGLATVRGRLQPRTRPGSHPDRPVKLLAQDVGVPSMTGGVTEYVHHDVEQLYLCVPPGHITWSVDGEDADRCVCVFPYASVKARDILAGLLLGGPKSVPVAAASSQLDRGSRNGLSKTRPKYLDSRTAMCLTSLEGRSPAFGLTCGHDGAGQQWRVRVSVRCSLRNALRVARMWHAPRLPATEPAAGTRGNGCVGAGTLGASEGSRGIRHQPGPIRRG